jgi:ribonuclease HI
MKNVTLYSDGACEGNLGSGNWAAILVGENHHLEISGGSPPPRNNRLSLHQLVNPPLKQSHSCPQGNHSCRHWGRATAVDGVWRLRER